MYEPHAESKNTPSSFRSLPMHLPSWIRELFRRLRCPHCHTLLTERALCGIGTGLQAQGAELPPQAAARLELHCPHCLHRTAMWIEISLDDLLEAVRLMHEHGPALRHAPHGQVEASDDRGVQALGPMDVAEVRTFLQALKRLSFRRNTQSFQRWIQQMEDDDAS